MRSYPLRFIHPKGRGSFSLLPNGLILRFNSHCHHFVKEDIQLLFCYRHALFLQAAKQGKSLFFQAHSSKENIQILKKNLEFSHNKHPCPYCGGSLIKGRVDYCPSCYRMFQGEKSLNDQGSQYFNFCSDAYFGPCIPEVEDRHLKNISGPTLSFIPLDDYLAPFFEKLGSHVAYLCTWLFISPLLNFLPAYTTYLFFFLLFFHLFFIGAYATELMVYKAFSRKMNKSPLKSFSQEWRQDFSKAESEAKARNLLSHPGVLINIYLSSKDPSLAQKYLEKAHDLCPQHPFIQKLYQQATSPQNPSQERKTARL